MEAQQFGLSWPFGWFLGEVAVSLHLGGAESPAQVLPTLMRVFRNGAGQLHGWIRKSGVRTVRHIIFLLYWVWKPAKNHKARYPSSDEFTVAVILYIIEQ